jgi:predicted O-methyltransferase YrrM
VPDPQVIEQAGRIHGWMRPAELNWLAEHAERARAIVEVGSWKGRSTVALAGHTPGRVFAIDHWLGQTDQTTVVNQELRARGADAIFDEFMANVRPFVEAGHLAVLRMDRIAAARTLADQHGPIFDLVFLDGDHDEAPVAADIATFRPLIKPGGILSGHDFGFAGVRAAVLAAVGVVQVCDTIWWRTV